MHGLRVQIHAKRFEVQRVAGFDVDDAADAPFLDIGLGAFHHLDLADDIRGQHQVIETARGVELIEDKPVGRGQRVSVVQGARQVRRRAADADPLALAILAVDDHAGHALYGFGQVFVGKFAHIFGRYHVDHGVGHLFGGQRIAQAAADADNDNFFYLGFVRLRRRALRQHGVALCVQCHGNGGSQRRGSFEMHSAYPWVISIVCLESVLVCACCERRCSRAGN